MLAEVPGQMRLNQRPDLCVTRADARSLPIAAAFGAAGRAGGWIKVERLKRGWSGELNETGRTVVSRRSHAGSRFPLLMKSIPTYAGNDRPCDLGRRK